MLNSDGLSPIDLALGIKSRINPGVEIVDKENEFSDVELAAVFLEHLKNYSYLHQGSTIMQTIIECIKCEVPGVGDFFDARFKKVLCIPG